MLTGMIDMASTKTPTKNPQTKPSKADIQVTRDSPFVQNLADLPKSKRSQHTYEWLEKAGPRDIFTAKTLAEAGVYGSVPAAASTLMRLHHAGLIKRVQRDGKDVKGAYQKA